MRCGCELAEGVKVRCGEYVGVRLEGYVVDCSVHVLRYRNNGR